MLPGGFLRKRRARLCTAGLRAIAAKHRAACDGGRHSDSCGCLLKTKDWMEAWIVLCPESMVRLHCRLGSLTLPVPLHLDMPPKTSLRGTQCKSDHHGADVKI
jgi:hypothetical protein